MNLCLEAKRRQGTRVYKRWLDNKSLYMEGIHMEAREVEWEESKGGGGLDGDFEGVLGGIDGNYRLIALFSSWEW